MPRRFVRALAVLTFSGLLAALVPARADADTATAAGMLRYLNDLRGSVGATAAREDSHVDAAAQAHANYLMLNGIIGHFETAGAPGYTGNAPRDRLAAQGYFATFVSEVAASYPGWQNAMTELWAAPYHRLGMLHPHNVVAGWGHSSGEATVGDFVYDFGASAPVVRSPAPGAVGVPTSWSGNESPNPLPAGAPRPVGYPIMIVEPSARTTALRGASLVRASDGAGVALYLGTQQFESDYAFVIPQRPLSPGTMYRVHFDLTVAGQATAEEWTFTTSADGVFHLTSLHSAWAGQSDPGVLVPGQVATVTLRFANTGTETWQKGVAGKQLNLGVVGDSLAYSDMAVGWLSANRVATTVEQTVAPGGVATFTLQVKAPSAPGSYRLPLRPVIDGVAWLDDQGVYVPVVVDGGFHSAWVDQSPYATLRTGVTTVLSVRFRNAGGRAWVRGVLGQEARVGVVGDDSRWASLGIGWLYPDRPAAQQEPTVAAGEVGTFTFTMRAPSTPGVHDIRLRPVIDGVTWMEDQGVFLRVTVTP